MKDIIDKKYLKISLYAIFTIVASILAYRLSSSTDNIMPSILATFQAIFSIFSPVVYGLVIAYLMTPATNFFEKKYNNFFKTSTSRGRSKTRGFSILTVYVIFFGALFFSVRYLIPEIFSNIQTFFNNIDGYIKSINGLLLTLENNLREAWPTMPAFLFEDFLEMIDMNYLIDISISYGNAIVSTLIASTFSFIGIFFNAIISFIVAIYALSQRETFSNGSKRFTYSLFKQERADKIIDIFAEAHEMMIKFFVGKSLDSLIIGAICFVGLSLLNNQYALLLAFIIGLCNMIPYFGPFIGAAPAIAITLFEGFFPALWVGLFILALQQFDGNYLGPKIVGNSLGITPFWIIASVTIGGGLAGAVGMFLACPIVAVILLSLNRWIDKKLSTKDIDIPKLKYDDILK